MVGAGFAVTVAVAEGAGVGVDATVATDCGCGFSCGSETWAVVGKRAGGNAGSCGVTCGWV